MTDYEEVTLEKVWERLGILTERIFDLELSMALLPDSQTRKGIMEGDPADLAHQRIMKRLSGDDLRV